MTVVSRSGHRAVARLGSERLRSDFRILEKKNEILSGLCSKRCALTPMPNTSRANFNFTARSYLVPLNGLIRLSGYREKSLPSGKKRFCRCSATGSRHSVPLVTFFTADSNIQVDISARLLYILIVCLFFFQGFNTFVVAFRELMTPLKGFFPFYCWKPSQVGSLNKK